LDPVVIDSYECLEEASYWCTELKAEGLTHAVFFISTRYPENASGI